MIKHVPELIIVGGPNGSGKSTFADLYVESSGIAYLGADAIAAEISDGENVDNFLAGRLFFERLNAALSISQSLIIESTLSGLGLKRHIQKAKNIGYNITLVFVTLDSPALCIGRVKDRVATGGHHVPDDDVIRRFYRSRRMFWTTYRHIVDNWELYENESNEFNLVAIGSEAEFNPVNAEFFAKFISSLEEVL